MKINITFISTEINFKYVVTQWRKFYSTNAVKPPPGGSLNS